MVSKPLTEERGHVRTEQAHPAAGECSGDLGEIESKDEQGNVVQNAYSDVWRFRDGEMAELRAFVVPVKK
ncbi:ketosteroid isomerase-like protein [Massilia sp. UYP11]|uniref:hypothetical protein n=1 Tax=Massilia sp. UYP11 TaxID=1756385 RepID=UPI003D1DB4DE